MAERPKWVRLATYLIAAAVIGIPLFYLRSLAGGGA